MSKSKVMTSKLLFKTKGKNVPKNVQIGDISFDALPLGSIEGPITAISHMGEYIFVGTASGRLYSCEAHWRLPVREVSEHWTDLYPTSSVPNNSSSICTSSEPLSQLDIEKSSDTSTLNDHSLPSHMYNNYTPSYQSFTVISQRSICDEHNTKTPSQTQLDRVRRAVKSGRAEAASQPSHNSHIHCVGHTLPSAVTQITPVECGWLLVLCNGQLCIYNALTLAFVDRLRAYGTTPTRSQRTSLLPLPLPLQDSDHSAAVLHAEVVGSGELYVDSLDSEATNPFLNTPTNTRASREADSLSRPHLYSTKSSISSDSHRTTSLSHSTSTLTKSSADLNTSTSDRSGILTSPLASASQTLHSLHSLTSPNSLKNTLPTKQKSLTSTPSHSHSHLRRPVSSVDRIDCLSHHWCPLSHTLTLLVATGRVLYTYQLQSRGEVVVWHTPGAVSVGSSVEGLNTIDPHTSVASVGGVVYVVKHILQQTKTERATRVVLIPLTVFIERVQRRIDKYDLRETEEMCELRSLLTHLVQDVYSNLCLSSNHSTSLIPTPKSRKSRLMRPTSINKDTINLLKCDDSVSRRKDTQLTVSSEATPTPSTRPNSQSVGVGVGVLQFFQPINQSNNQPPSSPSATPAIPLPHPSRLPPPTSSTTHTPHTPHTPITSSSTPHTPHTPSHRLIHHHSVTRESLIQQGTLNPSRLTPHTYTPTDSSFLPLSSRPNATPRNSGTNTGTNTGAKESMLTPSNSSGVQNGVQNGVKNGVSAFLVRPSYSEVVRGDAYREGVYPSYPILAAPLSLVSSSPPSPPSSSTPLLSVPRLPLTSGLSTDSQTAVSFLTQTPAYLAHHSLPPHSRSCSIINVSASSSKSDSLIQTPTLTQNTLDSSPQVSPQVADIVHTRTNKESVGLDLLASPSSISSTATSTAKSKFPLHTRPPLTVPHSTHQFLSLTPHLLLLCVGVDLYTIQRSYRLPSDSSLDDSISELAAIIPLLSVSSSSSPFSPSTPVAARSLCVSYAGSLPDVPIRLSVCDLNSTHSLFCPRRLTHHTPLFSDPTFTNTLTCSCLEDSALQHRHLNNIIAHPPNTRPPRPSPSLPTHTPAHTPSSVFHLLTHTIRGSAVYKLEIAYRPLAPPVLPKYLSLPPPNLRCECESECECERVSAAPSELCEVLATSALCTPSALINGVDAAPNEVVEVDAYIGCMTATVTSTHSLRSLIGVYNTQQHAQHTQHSQHPHEDAFLSDSTHPSVDHSLTMQWNDFLSDSDSDSDSNSNSDNDSNNSDSGSRVLDHVLNTVRTDIEYGDDFDGHVDQQGPLMSECSVNDNLHSPLHSVSHGNISYGQMSVFGGYEEEDEDDHEDTSHSDDPLSLTAHLHKLELHEGDQKTHEDLKTDSRPNHRSYSVSSRPYPPSTSLPSTSTSSHSHSLSHSLSQFANTQSNPSRPHDYDPVTSNIARGVRFCVVKTSMALVPVSSLSLVSALVVDHAQPLLTNQYYQHGHYEGRVAGQTYPVLHSLLSSHYSLSPHPLPIFARDNSIYYLQPSPSTQHIADHSFMLTLARLSAFHNLNNPNSTPVSHANVSSPEIEHHLTSYIKRVIGVYAVDSISHQRLHSHHSPITSITEPSIHYLASLVSAYATRFCNLTGIVCSGAVDHNLDCALSNNNSPPHNSSHTSSDTHLNALVETPVCNSHLRVVSHCLSPLSHSISLSPSVALDLVESARSFVDFASRRIVSYLVTSLALPPFTHSLAHSTVLHAVVDLITPCLLPIIRVASRHTDLHYARACLRIANPQPHMFGCDIFDLPTLDSPSDSSDSTPSDSTPSDSTPSDSEADLCTNEPDLDEADQSAVNQSHKDHHRESLTLDLMEEEGDSETLTQLSPTLSHRSPRTSNSSSSSDSLPNNSSPSPTTDSSKLSLNVNSHSPSSDHSTSNSTSTDSTDSPIYTSLLTQSLSQPLPTPQPTADGVDNSSGAAPLSPSLSTLDSLPSKLLNSTTDDLLLKTADESGLIDSHTSNVTGVEDESRLEDESQPNRSEDIDSDGVNADNSLSDSDCDSKTDSVSEAPVPSQVHPQRLGEYEMGLFKPVFDSFTQSTSTPDASQIGTLILDAFSHLPSSTERVYAMRTLIQHQLHTAREREAKLAVWQTTCEALRLTVLGIQKRYGVLTLTPSPDLPSTLIHHPEDGPLMMSLLPNNPADARQAGLSALTLSSFTHSHLLDISLPHTQLSLDYSHSPNDILSPEHSLDGIDALAKPKPLDRSSLNHPLSSPSLSPPNSLSPLSSSPLLSPLDLPLDLPLPINMPPFMNRTDTPPFRPTPLTSLPLTASHAVSHSTLTPVIASIDASTDLPPIQPLLLSTDDPSTTDIFTKTAEPVEQETYISETMRAALEMMELHNNQPFTVFQSDSSLPPTSPTRNTPTPQPNSPYRTLQASPVLRPSVHHSSHQTAFASRPMDHSRHRFNTNSYMPPLFHPQSSLSASTDLSLAPSDAHRLTLTHSTSNHAEDPHTSNRIDPNVSVMSEDSMSDSLGPLPLTTASSSFIPTLKPSRLGGFKDAFRSFRSFSMRGHRSSSGTLSSRSTLSSTDSLSSTISKSSVLQLNDSSSLDTYPDPDDSTVHSPLPPLSDISIPLLLTDHKPLCTCTPFSDLPLVFRRLALCSHSSLTHHIFKVVSAGLVDSNFSPPPCSCDLSLALDLDSEDIDMSPYLQEYRLTGEHITESADLHPLFEDDVDSHPDSPDACLSPAPTKTLKVAADELVPVLCWALVCAKIKLAGTTTLLASLTQDPDSYVMSSLDAMVQYIGRLTMDERGEVVETDDEVDDDIDWYTLSPSHPSFDTDSVPSDSTLTSEQLTKPQMPISRLEHHTEEVCGDDESFSSHPRVSVSSLNEEHGISKPMSFCIVDDYM